MSAAPTRLVYVAVCAAFFGSGVTALLLETLWFRLSGLAIGSGTLASALTLSAFMAGLAMGSGLAARVARRLARPARAYAAMELVVGVVGAALVWALPALAGALAPWLGALGGSELRMACRFGLAFLLMLAPATAMGTTLPLLSQALGRLDPRFGRTLGRLYGYNTLGAVCGVLWAEYQLLELLGISGTALVALGVSVAAAAIAFAADARTPALRGGAEPQADGAPTDALRQPEGPISSSRLLLWSAAASGALVLALEVVWLRLLTLFLNDTPRVFALILALVLVGIALGGLAGGWLSTRLQSPEHALGPTACVAAALALGGYGVLPRIVVGVLDSAQAPATVVMVAAPLIVPTCLASGALFTLLGATLRMHGGSDAEASGRLALYNTLGGALGSLLAGAWLIPSTGVTAALFGLATGFGLLGLVLLISSDLSQRARYASAAVLALAIALFPFGDLESRRFLQASASRWLRGNGRVVGTREGRDATLMYIEHDLVGVPTHVQMLSNAYSMSSTSFYARRYMKLYAYWPLAVMERVERVLVIGFGVGSTLKALTDSSEPKQIDLVDVSPDPIQMSGVIYRDPKHNPLGDPRVRVRIEDGRFHLKARDETYDLITGEPPPPIMAGVTNLYSREYFELLRSRLSPGGVVTYWLPLKNITAATTRSIVRAFCDAFEDCSLWNGCERDYMLVGTNGLDHAVSPLHFSRQWRDRRARDELLSLGFEQPEQLGALFIGDAAYLAELTKGAEPLTDDRPKRMHQPGTREELTKMLWQFRDTRAALERFQKSPLIAALWPEEIKRATPNFFELQRLLNDLLFPGPTQAKQAHVLRTVLTRTEQRFPVILLLDSAPDIQSALARADEKRFGPLQLLDVAAGQLAARDYRAARATLRRIPETPELAARRKLIADVLEPPPGQGGLLPSPSP